MTTREQIEAASFDAYEIQKLAFAKHGVKLDNPFYEDMYTAGFEAGVKWLLQYKEQWQREAWEAARTETMVDPQQFDDKGVFWLPSLKYGSMDDWRKDNEKA